MMERIVSLGADYVSTVGALTRTEARQDLSRIGTALRARAIGALVLAVGIVWLNVAVLLWLLALVFPPWLLLVLSSNRSATLRLIFLVSLLATKLLCLRWPVQRVAVPTSVRS